MPFAKVGDVNLYYEEEGTGPPILVIQGLGYDHTPFFWLRRELAKRLRVIVFDNRGVGRSDVPPPPYSIEQMANDAAGILDNLGIETAAVFGVSLGGYVAQMMALRWPERVGKLLLGCTFFSGNPNKIKMPEEARQVITTRTGTPEEIARRGLGVAFSKEFPARRPEIFEQLVRWRVERPVSGLGYFAQLQAAMEFDVENEVGRITGEVLVLHGELDRVVPVERGKELAAAIVGARLQVLKGAGHLFFIEMAEKVAGLITRFVRGKEKRRPPLAAAVATPARDTHPYHRHDYLAVRASLSPEKTALVEASSGERRSYAALNENASRIATFMATVGLQKGHRVGVVSLNRIAVVEILYACGKLGALFVPFNYRLSPAELEAIVSDASISLLFFDGHAAPIIQRISSHLLPPASRRIALDEDAAAALPGCLRYESILEPRPLPPTTFYKMVTTDDPWIICYTGGTTGRPKGALLTHGSILWNAFNTIIGWGLRDDDVAPIFTPLFHTGGLNVLLTPLLLLGGTCIIVRTFNPKSAFEVISKYKATYIFMVPTMYRMMMAEPAWEDENFPTVRELVTGGAPCPRSIYEAFKQKGKRFRMGYGLTEAGPNNFHIDPEKALPLFGSVGKPLPFVEAAIDGQHRPGWKPGEVGELLLRGGHLFGGYWRKREETRTVFENGWLRTGDLARTDEEGNFYIVGRKKEMFISGGENVYPAEVEEVLLRYPTVQEAAVTGVPDEKWGEVGMAAVVLKEGAKTTADDLTAFCRTAIAHYKVPKKIIFLPELPKTGAGKVDKLLIARMYTSLPEDENKTPKD